MYIVAGNTFFQDDHQCVCSMCYLKYEEYEKISTVTTVLCSTREAMHRAIYCYEKGDYTLSLSRLARRDRSS